MDRRTFLQSALAGLGGVSIARPLAADVAHSVSPFTLGIASGDVTDREAVLWTRLAPDPQRADGGMPSTSVPVLWELARDPQMRRVVQRGRTNAVQALAHSVHVELEGLTPGSTYWYRFTAGSQQSRIGRTRTLPARGVDPGAVRFVTASCQNYTHGHFVAYDHIVRDNPDFVIHLGDYIYDTSFGETFRSHETERAPVTLDDFRRRHALYKTDQHLQNAHAQIPFFVAVDNHDAIEDNNPEQAAQRSAAYQAWYEHMPVRGFKGAGVNALEIHRHIALGDLLQISLLDVRQFRDQRSVCDGPVDSSYGFGNYRERCEAVFDSERTMLGDAQEQWLVRQVRDNPCAWNVLASPGPFLPFSYQHQGKDLRYIGAWDVYPAQRQRIARALSEAPVGHPLVLSGDVHSFWTMDGALATQPQERIPVVEFVTSSISANWPPQLAQPVTDNLAFNPQVQFYDPLHRGYLLHEVNRDLWHTFAQAVSDTRSQQSVLTRVASFRVQRGKPGVARS